MKWQLYVKRLVDFVMFVLFVLLMERHLIPYEAHEWIGISLFALFITHNALNYKWYRVLFQGRYTATRVVQTAINFLLWIAMLGCAISGILSSVVLFPSFGGAANAFGRRLHWLASAWAFILMSIHLGLHWAAFVGSAKRIAQKTAMPARLQITVKWACRVIVLALCAYGLYIFIEREFWEEMFLLIDEFGKIFDYSANAFLYFLQTTAFSALIASITYYLKKLCLWLRRKKKWSEVN